MSVSCGLQARLYFPRLDMNARGAGLFCCGDPKKKKKNNVTIRRNLGNWASWRRQDIGGIDRKGKRVNLGPQDTEISALRSERVAWRRSGCGKNLPARVVGKDELGEKQQKARARK
jgi:hypothetical protein